MDAQRAPVCHFLSAPPCKSSSRRANRRSLSTPLPLTQLPPHAAPSSSSPPASSPSLLSSLTALASHAKRPRSAALSKSAFKWSRSFGHVLRRASYIHIFAFPLVLLFVLEMPWAFHSSFETAPVLNRSLMRDVFRRHLPPSNTTFAEPQLIRPGISIVASCMNRHHTLQHVLSRWRDVRHVSEILIVDWSSNPPLLPAVRPHLQQDPRIRLLRVDAEPSWVLSRAYNLAMRAASFDTLLRTDCDYAIARDFVRAHALNGSTYYAGNYAAARDENEVHLNGAVLVNRADVLRVGGYDERIQTYGWDDEELYARLNHAGLRKLNISYDHISHVPHADDQRAQKDVSFVQVEIDLNSLLLKQLPTWNASALQHFTRQWAVSSAPSPQYTVLHAVSRPRALKQLVSAERLHDAWDTALGQRLANDFNVPWDIMATMRAAQKRLLLSKLNARMRRRDASRPARVLFAHVMHGLGNRLRALGSAMSFANATDRELVLIWQTDAHIAAEFTELFESGDMVVMTQFKPKWPFKGYDKYDESWRLVERYNYMEMEGDGAVKGQRIAPHDGQHVYFKSAYVMEADARLTDWDKDNAMLRSLRPVREVRELVQRMEAQGLQNMVGVHIRDRTLERDIKNVQFAAEYGAAASAEMEHWRRKSSYKTFVKEMQRLVAQDASTRFFVATDTVRVLHTLRRTFGARVLWVARDCDGRDARCVRFALADVLCLARARALLGSNWSSFTEAASRLGGRAARLAGVDFARDGAE